MKVGGNKVTAHHAVHEHRPSIWPQWNENKPFALVLLLLGAFAVIYLNVRITQVQQETSQPGANEHTIVVDGTGTVTGTPDIATVTLGVDTKGADVATAQTQNATTVNALLAQVKALGVADADIQTSNYSAYENSVWNSDTETYESNGWIVSQTLTVKVRDTAKVSTVLDVAGKSGITNISGPSFTIDDPSNLKDQARAEAVADAKAKAQKLAAELGVTLERVIGYVESTNSSMPYPYYDMMSVGGSSAPDIAVGSNDVTLNVSITYKIAD